MNRLSMVSWCVLGLMVMGVAAVNRTLGEDAGKAKNLNLFAEGVSWKAGKVNGSGEFTLGKDGDKAIGTLSYDFSGESAGGGGRYVLATTEVNIPEGATQLMVSVRGAMEQGVGMRIADATGQTFQWKKKIKGGAWETLTIDLTKKAEHWGGDNDGVVHFPIKKLTVQVPMPKEAKTGKVDFADVMVVSK